MENKILMALIFFFLLATFVNAENLGTKIINVSKDARIDIAFPNDNFGTKHYQLRVGREIIRTYRSYLGFDLSSLPANTNIVNANLVLNKIGGPSTNTIEVHLVNDNSWIEDQITWNNAPAFNQTNETVMFINSTTGTKSFNITETVKKLFENKQLTFSLLLKSSDENTQNHYQIFQNREIDANQPQLEIKFVSNPPQINVINAPNNIDEGQTLNVNFNASDSDGDISRYKIFKNNELVSESNSYSWQTDYESSGVYEFRFYVEDLTGLNSTETRTVSVNNIQSIVINEFVPNPETGYEWIELYNPSDNNVSLLNCRIRDGYGNGGLLSSIIQSKDFIVIVNVSMLNNDGDLIKLYCNDLLVDSVAYGNWNDGDLADNAPLANVSQSTGRSPNGVDSDNDKNDFKIFTNPSYGYSNFQCEEVDTNCNGCVEMTELMSYIGRWKADSSDVTMIELMNAIGLWKSGVGC